MKDIFRGHVDSLRRTISGRPDSVAQSIAFLEYGEIRGIIPDAIRDRYSFNKPSHEDSQPPLVNVGAHAVALDIRRMRRRGLFGRHAMVTAIATVTKRPELPEIIPGKATVESQKLEIVPAVEAVVVFDISNTRRPTDNLAMVSRQVTEQVKEHLPLAYAPKHFPIG